MVNLPSMLNQAAYQYFGGVDLMNIEDLGIVRK